MNFIFFRKPAQTKHSLILLIRLFDYQFALTKNVVRIRKEKKMFDQEQIYNLYDQ